MYDDAVSVVKAGAELSGLIGQLQPFCDSGTVADITLTNGPPTTGVLLGVSSTTLILDRWDERAHRPAGDPFSLDLDSVAEVVIP
jgi:hypothetical protein